MENLVTITITAAIVSIITQLVMYVFNRIKKSDDVVEKAGDKYISKQSCTAIRNDCIGKRWEDALNQSNARTEKALERLEETFNNRFNEFRELFVEFMRGQKRA